MSTLTILARREFLRRTVAAGFAFTLAPLVPVPGKPSGGSTGAGIPDLDPDMSDARLRQQWRMHELTEGWRRAAASGRPLLIIVVPRSAQAQGQRGDAWGEVITVGSDEAIAALTGVELVTATQDEIHTVLPAYRIETSDDEPLVVRIEAAEMPARYEAFHTTLSFPTESDRTRFYELDYEERERVEGEWITARITSLEALILSATRPDPEALKAVSKGQLVERRRATIPGSRWGQEGSCAGDSFDEDPLEAPLESPDYIMVGCGMGHVDYRTARFLDFLTEDPERPVKNYMEKQR